MRWEDEDVGERRIAVYSDGNDNQRVYGFGLT